ncbi:envelope stress response membrane protein PspC [Vibrio rumoiensis]|uniref:Phage shock protein C n=1 Tax=Vibrio rumoiensis 1S-45 TaxID=1188252 RepID=A0A1E5E461_9VIBR|nr:envelope stress response membrane protein PspC [Vibrio rumoiensis]OEF27476.1 phage shock protein C [Vibrio rumoiensis 1S-45]
MDRSALYREPKNGKIAGVCAGLGRYFGMEVWWMRIIAVSVFLLGGGILVLFAYVGLWLMLEKRPASFDAADEFDFDHTIKSKPWQKGQVPADLLKDLDKEYAALEVKIRNMEAYVTSDAYKVNKEFSQL